MAREFKQITGTITKINAPYFAEKRNVWVMMVKTNENWVAINSRNEVKYQQNTTTYFQPYCYIY